MLEKCYWPLLRLARKHSLPFGIEASGCTLEAIGKLDKNWIAEFRTLLDRGICEFVGSGYAQIIGPLVPAKVNVANLRIGNQVYRDLLGIQPRIALVAEQAYSAGLIQHYLNNGYQGIVMEWDNPSRFHPEWDPEWRYLPQVACGQHGEELPLLWNKSIAFQKFQRYAHGEMELEEYLDYLTSHLSESPRAMSLYGNDVEIFDFRPGRYHTEADLSNESEWERLEKLFMTLKADARFRLVAPGSVMDMLSIPGAGNRLSLESPECPIPVKKQGKYNITRWAVTGRDDLGINTISWRIHEILKRNQQSTEENWKELCYLWSSDFRTHITENRWESYKARLLGFEKKIGADRLQPGLINISGTKQNISLAAMPDDVHISRNESFLTVETEAIKLRLNFRRGLAIDALWFKDVSDDWLCGTMHHGYYDDINWGADYYTGHLVQEAPGHRRITDLEPVESLKVAYHHEDTSIKVQGKIQLDCGNLCKSFRIHTGSGQPYIEIEYQLDQPQTLPGSLRLGYITINPEAFSQRHLFYAVHNGGNELETYNMTEPFNHGGSVSFLVSASHILGCTGSFIKLGDHRHIIDVNINRSASALAGAISFQKVGNSYLCRLFWSAQEMDDTSKANIEPTEPFRCTLRVSALQAGSVST